jgi:hypothetical protein
VSELLCQQQEEEEEEADEPQRRANRNSPFSLMEDAGTADEVPSKSSIISAYAEMVRPVG